MRKEEIKELLEKPKNIMRLNDYIRAYYALTGKRIKGCVNCKLTYLYNTLKKLI